MKHFYSKLLHYLQRLYNNFLELIFSFNLTKLAQIYKTDKWGRHYYTLHYQKYFQKFKFKRIKLLEIGVGGEENPFIGGHSLRMWKKFFPFGKIFSIDIYDKKYLQERRIKIFQGSQADKNFLENIMRDIGKMDIIIDDGSHINSDVINSFEILFSYLRDGGIYVIEDTETSYRDDFGGDSRNLSKCNTTMNFFKSFPDRINSLEFNIPEYKKKSYEDSIFSIHFYHNLIFIFKKNQKEKPSNPVKKG